jgi:two-component system response regulator NreC
MTAGDRLDRGAVRLLLVDDHAVVREGLRALLEREPDLVVVAEAATVAAAVATDVEADVVVADLMLPDAQGPEVVSAIRARHPHAAVVVLTVVDEPSLVRSAIATGAAGYLLKEVATTELVSAIRSVSRGGSYLLPSLGVSLARSGPDEPAVPSLSPTERDVLRLLAEGHTNREIAAKLFLSRRTIESYRSRLATKLGVRTRAELVRSARALGIIDS